MTTITASPTHARLLRAYVIAALNLDDQGLPIVPAPFTDANVVWSDRDHPKPLMYAMIREVAHVDRGPPQVVPLPDRVTPDLPVHHHVVADWTVSVQLVVRPDQNAPTLAAADPWVWIYEWPPVGQEASER